MDCSRHTATHPGSTWDQGGLFLFRNFPESKPHILLVVLVFLVSSWVWQNPGRAHLSLLLRSTRVRRALGISWNANHTPLRWFLKIPASLLGLAETGVARASLPGCNSARAGLVIYWTSKYML